MGKGKGKGKSFITKGMRNAIPKEWDADQLVIPEFGATQGISFYTVNNLLTEGMSTYEVRTPTALVRSATHGHPTEYLDNRQIRMRSNPSDLNQDGTPIHNMIFHYNSALRAIHEVRHSVQRFQFMEENERIVSLRGSPISNGYPTDPHYLLEENQKSLLGDFWRVLRHRPTKNMLKSSNPDVEYIPNNAYPYYKIEWDQYYLHLLPLVLEHPKLMLAESKQMTETLRKIYKASSDFIGDASLSFEQQVALKTRSLCLPLLADNPWEPSEDEEDTINETVLEDRGVDAIPPDGSDDRIKHNNLVV